MPLPATDLPVSPTPGAYRLPAPRASREAESDTPGPHPSPNRSAAASVVPSVIPTLTPAVAPAASPDLGPVTTTENPPRPRRRRVTLGGVVRVLVGLGLPALLVVRLGAGGVVAALSDITPLTIAAALALGAITTVAGAARWCVVARGVGLRLSLRTATADAYRATLLNSLLPAGVLGDVHRAVRHHRPGDARGARAVVIERVAGQVVVVAAGIAVLLAHPVVLHQLIGPGFGIVAGALGLAVLVAAAWLVTARRAGRARAAVLAALGDVREGLGRLRTAPAVLVFSLVALGGLLALFVLAARVAGVGGPLGQVLALVTVALLAMSVPLTVGGWGPREAAASVAFAAVGLDPGQGLATSVVYGVLALISCLPGAVVLLADAVGRPNARRWGTSSPLPWRACSPSSATVRVRPTPAG